MDDDVLDLGQSECDCDHKKQRVYTEKRLDVLDGFELTFIRCLNCHKIVELQARKYPP
ncbi:MAG: hypothetical protein NWE92_12375 [Candidatus Bathyarchaeota archaeon]|nr:hypothetical protein [Candidatus Bathyarchaeota archaeon]